MISDRKSAAFLVSFFGVMVLLGFVLPPFPQDPNYHNFAVDRTIFSIPHAWNVLSNIPFVIVAILAWMDKDRDRAQTAGVFRFGVFLKIGRAHV